MKLKCCLCNSRTNSTTYKEVDGFHLLSCNQCDLVYLDETQGEQEDFFTDSENENNDVEYWSTPNLYDQHQEVFDHFFKERLSRMMKYGVSKGKVLDIGTGYGFWSNYLRDKGFMVDGIEISPKVTQYANNKYDLEVKCLPVEDYESDSKYDAIFLFDVLEHLEDPENILRKLKGMLNKKGIIYIQVPNVLGLKYPYGHSLGLPYHLWQFNPNSLKQLMRKSELNPLEYWTGIQGVIGAHQRGEASILKKALWKTANLIKRGNRVQIICRA